MSASGSLIDAIGGYVDKIVTDERIGGMKVLVLDDVTKRVCSMVYSQSQILEKQVYLVEQLGAAHESMTHLKAAVFVQPTPYNIELLKRELAEPKYAEYHIFFSNIVKGDALQSLAGADEHDLIRQVHEYYGDFEAVNEDLFSLAMPDSIGLTRADNAIRPEAFARTVSGVLSVLLSLKRKPSQIRYAAGSTVARQVANEVAMAIDADDVFDFRSMGRRVEGPLLLILDRKDDPVTPLLSQWTYQAMVHEVLGLNHNRVVLKDAPGVKPELQEVVLSPTQDQFFRDHRHSNYGDLAIAVKTLLEEFQAQRKLNEDIRSIEDMQRFLDRYPAFKAQSHAVEKHMAILTELTRKMETQRLLECSELEQLLACNNDHSLHLNMLLGKLDDPLIPKGQKLRLGMLYALRYEATGNLAAIKARLEDAGIALDQIAVINSLLNYGGSARRGPPADDLFGPRGVLGRMTRSFVQGLSDVENVLTQHEPLLHTILESVAKGKVKDQSFPSMGASSGIKHNSVIVYMIGGATYEESKVVANLNKAMGQTFYYLGGTTVHNSKSFLKEVAAYH